MTDTPWAGADTDQPARLRTALAAERTVFAVMRSGLAIAGGGAVIVTLLGDRRPEWLQIVLAVAPDRHRMVSPWLMAVLIGVVQVVVTVVVILLIVDAFEC